MIYGMRNQTGQKHESACYRWELTHLTVIIFRAEEVIKHIIKSKCGNIIKGLSFYFKYDKKNEYRVLYLTK